MFTHSTVSACAAEDGPCAPVRGALRRRLARGDGNSAVQPARGEDPRTQRLAWRSRFGENCSAQRRASSIILSTRRRGVQ